MAFQRQAGSCGRGIPAATFTESSLRQKLPRLIRPRPQRSVMSTQYCFRAVANRYLIIGSHSLEIRNSNPSTLVVPQSRTFKPQTAVRLHDYHLWCCSPLDRAVSVQAFSTVGECALQVLQLCYLHLYLGRYRDLASEAIHTYSIRYTCGLYEPLLCKLASRPDCM